MTLPKKGTNSRARTWRLHSTHVLGKLPGAHRKACAECHHLTGPSSRQPGSPLSMIGINNKTGKDTDVIFQQEPRECGKLDQQQAAAQLTLGKVL